MNAQTLGQRLRIARQRLNLTLRDVSARVPGLTVTALSNYEADRRTPAVDVVKRLADTLETSAGWLLGLDDAASSDAEQALLRAYRAADPRGRAAILRLAEAESHYCDPADCASAPQALPR